MILKVFAIFVVAMAFVLPSAAKNAECNPQDSWAPVYQFPEQKDSRNSWVVNFDQLVQEGKLNGDYARYVQEQYPEVKALNGVETSEFVLLHNSCTMYNTVRIKPASGKQVVKQFDAGSSQVQASQNGVVEYRYSAVKNVARGALYGLGIAAPFVVPGFAGYGLGAGLGTAASFIRPKAVWVQPEFEKSKQQKNQRRFSESGRYESEGAEIAQYNDVHYERVRRLSKQWY